MCTSLFEDKERKGFSLSPYGDFLCILYSNSNTVPFNLFGPFVKPQERLSIVPAENAPVAIPAQKT